MDNKTEVFANIVFEDLKESITDDIAEMLSDEEEIELHKDYLEALVEEWINANSNEVYSILERLIHNQIKKSILDTEE